MDSIHDLGGKQGYGAVVPTELPAATSRQRAAESSVPRDKLPMPMGVGFESRWHASVFACMRAIAAAGIMHNTDQFRHAIERINPAAYLTHGYYGRWLGGIENILAEAQVLNPHELDEKTGFQTQSAANPKSPPDHFSAAPSALGSDRPVAATPGFATGDNVRTARFPVTGHTRLPAYARNKTGRVIACHGGWVLPDSNAHGNGECPQHLYTVAFDNTELWGDRAEPNVVVHLDLFEEYLQADE